MVGSPERISLPCPYSRHHLGFDAYISNYLLTTPRRMRITVRSALVISD
jgi:hypothetical protein